ncbi:MAG TPA: nuclear transport factor 2 family protein [Actinomycetota bacterium]|nr:nuclear transport factor 2 family protein [Actinomycetota bacterium]
MAAPDHNEILLRMAYDAQARGDIDAYLDLLSEDVVFHVPGRSRIAGEYRGKDEVRRHFQEIRTLSGGTFRTEIHEVLAGEEHVVGLVRGQAERDGATVDLPRVHVWHVKNGKLGELWVHPADQYAFDEYWGERTEPKTQ